MSEVFKENEKNKITALTLKLIFDDKPLHYDINKKINDFAKKYKIVLKKSQQTTSLKHAIMQFVENERGEQDSLNTLYNSILKDNELRKLNKTNL